LRLLRGQYKLVDSEGLENDLPAVDVKQNATPARHDVAMVVSPLASGRDSRSPMTVVGR
jgi:hypothetical protein